MKRCGLTREPSAETAVMRAQSRRQNQVDQTPGRVCVNALSSATIATAGSRSH
jgi:hypothetical protein